MIVLRPFNIYGPEQDKYFLLPKIALQLKDSNCSEISVHNLNTKRDYVFIKDFCEAISLATKLKSAYEIINIGSGVSYSTNQIIELLISISGHKKPINSLEIYRKNEIMDVVADNRHAEQVLGWVPKTSLTEGLKALYDSL